MRQRIAQGAVAALVAATWSAAAPAQQKIELRVADSFPASHYMVAAAKSWMEAVTQKTHGQVTFKYFGNEQLGKAKDMLALTQAGAADIAYVAPSYVSEKMPLSAVAELPGGFSTSCQGTVAFWKLARDGILAKREYEPNQVRLAFTAVSAPYQILTTKTPIESSKSFAGLKLRAYGPTQELAMRKLGAVPVRMAGPEIRESLSRGTLDGIVFPWASLASYDLTPLVKYSTIHQHFGAVAFNYVMNLAKWKSLPPEVQKAMEEAGEEVTRATCTKIDQETAELAQKLKSQGIAITEFPPAEQQRIREAMKDIGPEWAKGLDQRGKPGNEVLKDFQQAVQAAR